MRCRHRPAPAGGTRSPVHEFVGWGGTSPGAVLGTCIDRWSPPRAGGRHVRAVALLVVALLAGVGCGGSEPPRAEALACGFLSPSAAEEALGERVGRLERERRRCGYVGKESTAPAPRTIYLSLINGGTNVAKARAAEVRAATADRVDLPTDAARLRGDVVLVLDSHVLVISALGMDDADAVEMVAARAVVNGWKART